MPFKTVFQLNPVASATIHVFLEFSLPGLHTIFLPSHWLLFHLTILKTMDRNIDRAGDRTSDILFSRTGHCTLPYELWGLAQPLIDHTVPSVNGFGACRTKLAWAMLSILLLLQLSMCAGGRVKVSYMCGCGKV